MTRGELIETVAKAIYGKHDIAWEDHAISDSGTSAMIACAFRYDAINAIRAIEAAGLKIIERAATEEMLDATHRMHIHCGVSGLWRAMFDAAPTFGGEK